MYNCNAVLMEHKFHCEFLDVNGDVTVCNGNVYTDDIG